MSELDIRAEYFDDCIIKRDFFDIICGDKIGAGYYRQVYEHRLDPNLVIKFEPTFFGEDKFANVLEWEAWKNVEFTKYAQWFAPCVAISPCGRVLIQRRTQPITSKLEMPKRIPSFFTDLKLANWGWLKEGRTKRVVCHDYGNNLLMAQGLSKRMRKPDFYTT